ncbi:MAG: hypothetical protein IKY43_03910, partial [Bacteroidales bacterium]|nr:hypothetical protein [Bacteroidales bacterium]
KLNDVDVEMDGVWRCLDLEAENKVYERITPSTNLDAELPDDDGGDENMNPGGNNNNNGDFVGLKNELKLFFLSNYLKKKLFFLLYFYFFIVSCINFLFALKFLFFEGLCNVFFCRVPFFS